ncbi:hypothetical protein LCI18_011792 [Fusarium solani-melongenae]|uniref:Uncharacterized protein n=1 Tax=Fusarium solani subsp. cucurbitae TaxID=2747967 RepID=A0ACD3ZIU0_FUSSC|nr:hypothetical protein LCI18_011792 [Fusarium solani-melongenae]
MSKDKPEQAEPGQLEGPWSLKRLLDSLLDLVLATAALLFVVFGGMIYMNHGTSATPGSTGRLLLDLAKYGPTVFPVLFAAIVGAALKTFATWRLQNGTRIAEAVFTQARLKAFNILAIAILLLWCLSPLGSQAALRAISANQAFRNSTGNLTVLDTFSRFRFTAYHNSLLDARRMLVPPTIASILSARLLQSRNQDIWGNIRLPLIERLTDSASDTSWINVSNVTELDYSSLVGVPVAGLPSQGNHTFNFSASYISPVCTTLKIHPENKSLVDLPDFNSSDRSNCRWTTLRSEYTLRVSLSQPCGNDFEGLGEKYRPGKDRTARVFLWESHSFGRKARSYAECHLYTTYVDVKMHCQGTLCSPTSVRRSPKPPRHGNWTVFDIGSSSSESDGFLNIFATMFPGLHPRTGQAPTIAYLVEPFNALSAFNDTEPAALPRETFETRLAHLINSELLLGIHPGDVAGGLTEENRNVVSINVVEMETYTREEIVQYNKLWLTMLFASSTILFGVSMAAMVVRFRILVPEVLGSLALGMLDNRCEDIKQSSFMSGDDKMAKMKEVKVMLGDVEPHAEIGRIALAAPMEDVVVGKVQKGKFYL